MTTNDPFAPSDPKPTPNPEASFESSKEHARQAADELRAAAGAKAQQLKTAAEARAHHLRESAEEKAHQIKGFAEQSWQDVRRNADDWRTEGERIVRANPAQAILAALGLGFILGLLFRK